MKQNKVIAYYSIENKCVTLIQLISPNKYKQNKKKHQNITKKIDYPCTKHQCHAYTADRIYSFSFQHVSYCLKYNYFNITVYIQFNTRIR